MPAYFNAGAFREKKSWHGEENFLFSDTVSIPDIMRKCNMDYQVEKLPIEVTMPNGTTINPDNRFAIVRPAMPYFEENEPTILRTVGPRYEVIQNIELAELLEPLNQGGYPLEGTAILKDGRVIYVQLSLGEWAVGGHDEEEHKSYLLVANDHAQGSVFFGNTNIRATCSNTYAMALRGNLDNIPHTGDMKIELDFRKELEMQALEHLKTEQEFLNHLFKVNVDDQDVDDFQNYIFPNPKPTRKMVLAQQAEGDLKDHDFVSTVASTDIAKFNSQKELAEKRRDALRNAFGEFNEKHQYAANTAYGLFNSLTWVTNHSETFKGSEDKKQNALMFGQLADFNTRGRVYLEEKYS